MPEEKVYGKTLVIDTLHACGNHLLLRVSDPADHTKTFEVILSYGWAKYALEACHIAEDVGAALQVPVAFVPPVPSEW